MKKIKFFTDFEFVDLPQSAKNVLPEWYKQIPKFRNNEKKPRITPSGTSNATVKACMPFFDTFLTGYTATLWQDLDVSYEGGSPLLAWRTEPAIAEGRGPNPHATFPIPLGCVNWEFVWKTPIMAQTPPGYDLLITHPLNRYDLPFTTLSGIVAGEMLAEGRLPFYLKEGFEGIIKKGTPIFQIIPIKRESWISEKDPSLSVQNARFKHDSLSTISGWYKNNIWKRKDYR